MTRRYFYEALRQVKKQGANFADRYPSLASMLGGPQTDPDVERLLEAGAYANAMLRRMLDDDITECTQKLANFFVPHQLWPRPAATTVAFVPEPSLEGPLIIPSGTELASTPVEGIFCRFRTVYDVELHPLELRDVSFGRSWRGVPELRLSLALNGLPLSKWRSRKIRVSLSGDYVLDTELYTLLRNDVTRITITPVKGGATAILPPGCLMPVGFGQDEALLPGFSHVFSGYQLLQDYFTFPSKFLSFDLTGLERWEYRGEGSEFTIGFELDIDPAGLPDVGQGSFVRFATPAVNIFSHPAEPVLINNEATRYPVRPSGPNSDHYRVFSLDKVTGLVRGTAEERDYAPFELFHPHKCDLPVYCASTRRLEAGCEFHISVAFPFGTPPPKNEILSISLTCTNGILPEALRVGDIRTPVDEFPRGVSFRNITPITPGTLPPLGPELKHRVVSHITLNHLSLASAENLRTLLWLHSFPENRFAATANQKRIEGIEEVTAQTCTKYVGGVPYNGSEITVKARADHFAGPGDLFLFGCVLDHFLAERSAVNTFTQLIIKETRKGDILQWKPRLGNRPL